MEVERASPSICRRQEPREEESEKSASKGTMAGPVLNFTFYVKDMLRLRPTTQLFIARGVIDLLAESKLY
jgi:hypothetical protein